MAGPNTSVSQTFPGGDDNLKIVSAEQFTNDATSTEEDSKLAIFFDEGLGYLYVRELGTGTDARTQLCHSIADGKLYVRKVSHLLQGSTDILS